MSVPLLWFAYHACMLLGMSKRTHQSLRLSPAGIKKADELAKEHHLNRSQVLRAAITTAFRNPSLLVTELKREGERS